MISGLISFLMEEAGTAPPEWKVSDELAPHAQPSDPTKKFIVLRGIHMGNKFFSSNGPYRSDWYEEIGCVDTVKEAQDALGLSPYIKLFR